MDKIIIIGAGGQCKSSIDIISSIEKFEIAGILDKKENIGNVINEIPIIGTDLDIEKFISLGYSFHIGIGQIKSNSVRKNIFYNLKNLGAKIPAIIAKSAIISKYAILGEGVLISHKAFVNSNATIGDNTIINTGAIVEHDTIIGRNCNISTGAIVNGTCTILDDCFIGSNAMISNNIRITNNTIIGGGSVVIKDIIESSTYVGSPVKKLY